MMKKSFFYAIAVAATLVGCSANDSENNNFVTCPTDDGLVPVMLGVSKPTVLVSRATKDFLPVPGTGTVGDTCEEKNVWKGQRVRVYMMNKGTLEPTHVTIGTKDSYIANTEFFTPYGEVSGPAYRTDNYQCYYPVNGASDFWGYRTDGAEKTEPQTTDMEMYVPFEIDGSQDLMTGQLTSEELKHPGLYSAASAREGLQPNLTFSHHLTRLTFSASCYNNDKRYGSNAQKVGVSEVIDEQQAYAYANDAIDGYVNLGMYIDSVIVESKNTGKMYFAWNPMANLKDDKGYARIEWDDAVKELCLRQRQLEDGFADPDTLPLVAMTRTQPSEKVRVPIGEALLVAPQNNYNLRVVMHQYLPKYDEGALWENYLNHPDDPRYPKHQRYEIQRVVYPSNGSRYAINLKSATKAEVEAGKSYNINLEVSSEEMIVLNVTLEKWENGGHASAPLE